MERLIALAAAVVGALTLAWFTEQTPRPVADNAPAGVFSASRAVKDVAMIAARPHPVGSAANARVRDQLVARMSAMGLSPRVQQTDTFRVRDGQRGAILVGGTVENLIGILPGRNRTLPALVLMAHYDSVPGSPGAADDAAGVASILEVVRAIKAQGTAERDIILLITDGEEAGLLGAQAYFDQDPQASRIGMLINLESRGGGGRVQMFQTGPQNGEMVKLFKANSVRPVSSSLSVFLYENMPNDTDFTVSRDKGINGLNFAFIGKQFDYHSPTSTTENLDKGSLQHMGDQALAATRAAAFAKVLPAKAPDAVYAQTFGGHLLAYPAWAGWGVLILVGGLMGLGLRSAREANALPIMDVVKGVSTALFLITFSAALFRMARMASGAGAGFMEQRFLLAQVVRWETAILLIGLGALTYGAAALGKGRSRQAAALLALAAGLGCSITGQLDMIGLAMGGTAAVLATLTYARPVALPGAWVGMQLTGLLVALGLQIAAPATAFLVAWPMVLASALGAASGYGTRQARPLLVLAALVGGLGASWLLGFAHGVFQGLDMVDLLALFVWLCAILLWPLFQPEPEESHARNIGLALLLAGFLVVAMVHVLPPWSTRHPRATLVLYHVDATTGRAARVSLMPDLDPWTERALTADGGKIAPGTLPILRRDKTHTATARSVAFTRPDLKLIREVDGSLSLTLVPPAGVRILSLEVKPNARLAGVTVNGQPAKIMTQPWQWTHLRWSGSTTGLKLGFRAFGPGSLEVRYATVAEQWPADARPLTQRPTKVMAFDISDSTLVTGESRFTW
jgi:hypothetical protein